ncbi:O-antigen ligase domain-containing protein [Cyanobacterium aponinum FACHB-4101]|uniref:O-antigen ligase domain-containing protein n=1 Tax=Cyanobacterium aponinum 0216 TaxID=2676140 RepID=A0A844GX71_9CHRO|nr:O-antigen ligase domain-containing protein [Cyanobacterium aponinum]MBD2394113.1 O-antigen ligase domain-containing protein [Cyanobacterium aponinum FACHB-4101]MTF38596.1 O-antigen ligase domain-containing protein [Cyanobacterium aponinum 0216]
MSSLAQLVMILWLPIVLFLFSKYPPRKAMIVSFLGGLLFLPQKAGFYLPLIPDYQGMVATCYGIFIGIIIYDSEVFKRFELKWIDYPMIFFGIAHLFSSLTNGLGLYDGINSSVTQIVQWGMPYFLGRLYLNNLSGLKELAINIIKAGLLYVPLCLYEVRMSPQLHNIVYGYFPHSFAQTMRFGGWRPQVFMQHGLMVGLFMMTATLVAIWLWQGRVIAKIWNIPIEWVVVILFVTFILIKSTGAYALMVMGLGILFSAKWLRLNLPLILLLLGIVGYLIIASSGNLQTDNIISSLQQIFPEDRVESLEFRFDNEELLGEKARERILFGWGGWGRNRIYAENWAGEMESVSVTDSLWIIVFGINGLFGLITLFSSLLLPVVYLMIRYPVNTWFTPKVSSAIVLGVCLTLFVVDCLVNAMFNPIFPLIGGGLSGLFIYSPQLSTRKNIRKIRVKTRKQVIPFAIDK